MCVTREEEKLVIGLAFASHVFADRLPLVFVVTSEEKEAAEEEREGIIRTDVQSHKRPAVDIRRLFLCISSFLFCVSVCCLGEASHGNRF